MLEGIEFLADIQNDEDARHIADNLFELQVRRATGQLNQLRNRVRYQHSDSDEQSIMDDCDRYMGMITDAAWSKAFDPSAVQWLSYATENIAATCTPLQYYGSIMGAALVHSEVSFRGLPLPVYQQTNTQGRMQHSIPLHGLGRAIVQGGARTASLERTREGEVLIHAGEETIHVPHDMSKRTETWRGIYRPLPSLYIDDLNPFRFHGTEDVQVENDLSISELQQWSDGLRNATDTIHRYVPEYADRFLSYLKVIIPLQKPEIYNRVTRNPGIIGAIAISKSTSHEYAVSLIEEIQRGFFLTAHKLSAMHNLPTAELRYYSPTYDTPVSLRDTLASVVCHPPVIKFWGELAQSLPSGAEQRHAATECARWGIRLSDITELYGPEELTEGGATLMEAVKHSSAILTKYTDGIDSETRSLASLLNDDHRLSWAIRNLCPTPESLSALIEQMPDGIGRVAIIDEIESPKVFTGISGNYQRRIFLQGSELPSTDGAIEQIRHGDFESAKETYRTRIIHDSHDQEAWAGFALCCHRLYGNDNAYKAIVESPEVVVALYGEMMKQRSGSKIIDPEEFVHALQTLRKPNMWRY